MLHPLGFREVACQSLSSLEVTFMGRFISFPCACLKRESFEAERYREGDIFFFSTVPLCFLSIKTYIFCVFVHPRAGALHLSAGGVQS